MGTLRAPDVSDRAFQHTRMFSPTTTTKGTSLQRNVSYEQRAFEDHRNAHGSQSQDIVHNPKYASDHDADTNDPPTQDSIEHPEDALGDEFMWDGEDDGEDLQPLEYARRHGLTTNYFDQNPLKAARLPSPSISLLADMDHPDDTRAAEPDKARTIVRGIYDGRWDVDKETAECLASVMSMARDGGLEIEHEAIRFSDLKIDEPVLSSDPGVDFLKFRARNAICLSTNGMEPCVLSAEEGEGLPWATEDLKLPAIFDGLVSSGKLDADRGTMELLRDVSKPSTSDGWDTVEQSLEASQARKLRRDTPPLLPCSPPLRPCDLPAELCEMELTSSPEDLMANEAAELAAQLLEQDEALQYSGSSCATLVAGKTSEDAQDLTKTPTASSSSPLRQKRLRDLKADTPLLSQHLTPSPAKRTKTERLPDEILTMIPAPETDDTTVSSNVAHQDLNAFITDVIAPMAQSVLHEVDNEKLDELDTVLRVDVPTVEDVQTVPPWKLPSDDGASRTSLSAHSTLLARINKEMPHNQRKWPGVSKVEQLLSWAPFPRHLSKISVEEQFDDGSWERYMAELSLVGGSIDLESFLWKPEGLRLLDPHDSDDDEVETVHTDHDGGEDGAEREQLSVARHLPDPSWALAAVEAKPVRADAVSTPQAAPKPSVGRMDMQALLRKRKLEIEAACNPNEVGVSNASHTIGRVGVQDQLGETVSDWSASLTSTGLSSFLGLQNTRVFRSQSPALGSGARVANVAPPAVMTAPTLTEPREAVAPEILPCPKLAQPQQARSIVLSSGMLANGQLVRKMQSLLPGLELVERDDANVTPNGSKTSSNCEADLALSAATGVICTSLQKLNQRSLPGQSGYSGIRERIARVASRYESLVVLVSEGKQDDVPPTGSLETRDAEAMVDLNGYVTSLRGDVEVIYVAGGQTELAKWIAASICRHCPVDTETKLLPDETIWERVLRTAGANPSAAQMMLAKLKRPHGLEVDESPSTPGGSDASPYGLVALLQMSSEARVPLFGRSMGGERVLGRVSELVDSGWMSASRG